MSEDDNTDYLDSEDDDEDDYEDLPEDKISQVYRNFLEETISQYNHQEHLEHFRVSKEVVEKITEKFQSSPYYPNKSSGCYGRIEPLHHVYIFLWFAGQETVCFRDVAVRFSITLSCVHRVLNRMIYFLSNLAPETIKWPNVHEQGETERYFRQEIGFPGIVGVVDGVHIKIDKPQQDQRSYMRKRGCYSIQAQLVCDQHLRIIDVFIGYPGSVDDGTVFRTSPLLTTLSTLNENYHLIGDRAYPLLPALLTPFEDDTGQLNQRWKLYNNKLSSSRSTIDRCNRLLKQKFKQLNHIKLRNIRTMINFIRACCVLHNLSLSDEFKVEDISIDEEAANNNYYYDPEEDEKETIAAKKKRIRIANMLK